MRQHQIELKPSELNLGKFATAALEELQSSIVSVSYSTALDAAIAAGQADLLTKVAQANLKRTLMCTILLANGTVLTGSYQRDKNIVLNRMHYRQAYIHAVVPPIRMAAMMDSFHSTMARMSSATEGDSSLFEELFRSPAKDETPPPNSNLH